MKIWSKIRQNSSKRRIVPKKYSDIISALEEIESKTKAHLKIDIPNDIAKQVKRFLNEKGLPWKEGIILLLTYGLSDETGEELEQLRHEKELKNFELSQKYSAMRFRFYEYYQENKALTMRLRLMLNENKSLKKTLEKEGLRCEVLKKNLDNWDEDKINDYYRRYVFGK
jgi:hypothetical protein